MLVVLFMILCMERQKCMKIKIVTTCLSEFKQEKIFMKIQKQNKCPLEKTKYYIYLYAK